MARFGFLKTEIDSCNSVSMINVLLLAFFGIFHLTTANCTAASFPGGYSTNFYTGRLLPEVQSLTILFTPFVYLLLTNGTPFKYLV